MSLDVTVKIALIQTPSVFGDLQTNTQRFEIQCRQAAAQGAKILVLPETALSAGRMRAARLVSLSAAAKTA